MGFTLYQLNKEYSERLNKLLFEEYESEEEEAQILDELANIEIEIEEKAENTAIVINTLTTLSNADQEEIIRLKERIEKRNKQIERLEKGFLYTMKLQGEDKIESKHFTFKITKSQRVHILDENNVPADWIKIKETRTVDKAGIKKAIKDGQTFDFAKIETIERVKIK